ncbi:hypothetical protein C0580_01980 [Candidatus Parcubacteria bacterium]|nr:MAG: hypothetical protein C0580_01980 [Candidatus Parcubacteria bacterium]
MAKHDSAKYAFFYLLSLVALVFVAISVGMIVFQIINKEIVDVLNNYSGSYSDDVMKFAISAIIVSAPIYYLTSRQIYKSLYKGTLDKDAAVRKWLTYLILLVAVIVMIGFLIATINSFLYGDLTTKFILKTLTALIISGSVFSFYLYDIRREEVAGKKDKVISYFAWVSLFLILIAFVASWFFVESPQDTRNRKIDREITSDLYQINAAVLDYYTLNEEVPVDLDVLVNGDSGYRLSQETITHPVNKEEYSYEVVDDDQYKICAEFLTSNIDDDSNIYYSSDYKHDKGYECFNQKAANLNEKVIPPQPVRID